MEIITQVYLYHNTMLYTLHIYNVLFVNHNLNKHSKVVNIHIKFLMCIDIHRSHYIYNKYIFAIVEYVCLLLNQ